MIKIVAISQPAFTSVNREIFRRLNKNGYEVTIIIPETITYSSGIKKAQKVKQYDPEIIFVKTKRNNPRLQKIISLNAILDSKKPDIVFLDNDPGSLQAFEISKWCKKNNAKCVVQSCENLPFDYKSSFKRAGFKGILLSFLKNALNFASKKNIDYVFTINNDGTQIFRNLGYKNVQKIPLGFNENIFNYFPEQRKITRQKLNLQGNVIAYFGRIVPEKGIHILLKALSNLQDLEWTFILDDFELYKNSYSETINNLISELDLKNKIKYIKADHKEIADYMNASDITVLASVSTPKWKEQYGRVIPEAMACKNAVIVANSGALPELVGDAGLIFEENNVDELTEKIKNLIENQDICTNYKEKAYQMAQKHLSIKSQFDVYDKIFKEIVNN
jgi:glycosyltransferase involved in cell wall biosynthesis